MVLGVFQRTIVDNSGDTIGSASVEVRREDNGALAVLFSDRAGTVGADNPFTAGPDGFAQFYLAQGSYRVVATSGGFSRTWRHEPVLGLPDDGNFDASAFKALAAGASAARSLAEHLGDVANPRDFGALGDLAERTDGTVTDASPVLSSAGANFEDADVGKAVWVEGAASVGKTITAIANGPVDAAWQFDDSAGTFVDLTGDINDAGGADVEPFPATEAVGDVFYLGHIQTFDKVTFDIATAGVGGVVAWEYWDGTTWSALTVTDGTSGFTAAPGSHDLTFTPPGDWATTQLNSAINGRRLYYIRARLTTVYSTNPVLDQAILDGGRIRVTSTLHLVEPLQTVSIKGVVGTTEANGTWQVERIDNDVLDLIGPSFQNAYVSGGTIHGRLETTILSVSAGAATLAANAGASIAGTAVFGYGSDDTAAIQAAIDTGKAVVVTAGSYLAATLTISTDGQKLIGMGGRIAALPAALHSSNDAQISVEADFVELSGLYLDNPTLQNKKEAGWPDSINTGIAVRGFQVNVNHNIVRRFRDGIKVRSSDGFNTGFEHSHNIIANNIVWEVLGSGSGRDQRIGNQGESDGDGITNHGGIAIITGNIVHARDGADCRIGIHCEALRDRHDPDPDIAGTRYPNRGTVISNNTVIGAGVDKRNGRFRRGIVGEGIQEVSATGNNVYGGGWWAMLFTTTTTEGSNISIVGNNVVWTRPDVDLAGDDWNPARSCIAVMSNGTDVTKGIDNVSVTGNNIDVFGYVSSGIRVFSNQIGGIEGHVRVCGNGVTNKGGGIIAADCFLAVLGVQELVLSDNIFRAATGRNIIRLQNGSVNGAIIKGNYCHQEDPNNADDVIDGSGSGIIMGNIIRGGGVDSIKFVNGGTQGLIIIGNIIDGPADDGVDGFGVTNGILAANIFTNVGDLYTTNWGVTATKLDVDNVKA